MMLTDQKFLSSSAEETFEFGKKLGSSLPSRAILCFKGDLAAGKTTLIKGIVEGANNYPSHLVSSPTFTYLHVYEGTPVVCHIDLYRFKGKPPEAIIDMSFEDYFIQDHIVCIEWSELLPYKLEESINITLHHQDNPSHRLIEVSSDYAPY
jgi:tRNA threonylcarbamoyladenosine biosynthesis protein TsaE